MALMCIPLRAEKIGELKTLIGRAGKKSDLVEIWLDRLKEPLEPAELLKFVKKPYILVNKGKDEKGLFRGNEKKKIEILAGFLDAGAPYVDVSIKTSPALLRRLIKSAKKGSRIILSYHDFKGTPGLNTLKKIRDKGFALGADIVKIATRANKISDNLEILNLLADSTVKRKPCIALCMGQKGLISRVLAPQFGSYIIYSALDHRRRTAPGQLTTSEYDKISSLLKL